MYQVKRKIVDVYWFSFHTNSAHPFSHGWATGLLIYVSNHANKEMSTTAHREKTIGLQAPNSEDSIAGSGIFNKKNPWPWSFWKMTSFCHACTLIVFSPSVVVLVPSILYQYMDINSEFCGWTLSENWNF